MKTLTFSHNQTFFSTISKPNQSFILYPQKHSQFRFKQKNKSVKD